MTSEQRNFLGAIFLVFVLALMTALWAFKLYSKIQICKTYYPELSIYVCIPSNYGIPPRVSK